MSSIYLIGSLRNPRVPLIGNELRSAGFEVFDDWFSGGPEADDCWKTYEQGRGHTYAQALEGLAARDIYDFDYRHLHRCDVMVLVTPAGKSAHLELGYMMGKGKPGFILFPDGEPTERWDVMYQFADVVCFSVNELIEVLNAQDTNQ